MKSSTRNEAVERTLSEPMEAHGILQVFAAALIALTAVDAVMLLVNRSGAPMATKLFAVRYGELLFIPAIAWVGWISRPLGHRRYLPVAAAVVTGYMMLTQLRGAWIWDGTFDAYARPNLPWLRSSVIGIAVALLIGAVPGRQRPRPTVSGMLLMGLAACGVASLVLPSYWPNDSSFAATRYLGISAALVVLSALYFIIRNDP